MVASETRRHLSYYQPLCRCDYRQLHQASRGNGGARASHGEPEGMGKDARGHAPHRGAEAPTEAESFVAAARVEVFYGAPSVLPLVALQLALFRFVLVFVFTA